MLNILINAYAVAPNWGSEQGMGWNWITNIAKYCKCFVITEGEWRKEIEEALEKHPLKNNIKFYYNPVSEEIRKMCWNQGDWRFYYYYHQWQKSTLKIAKEICKENRIDVIHQLNMVGFREPGLLWKIKGIPYVWGPVGGMDNITTEFIKEDSIKTKVFYNIKNFINTLQYSYQPSVRKAIKNSDVIISAVRGVDYVVKSKYNKETIIIPETGIKSICIPIEEVKRKGNKNFELLWVGRFISTKKLDIALQTIAKLKHIGNIKLNIVGFGMNNEEAEYRALAKKLGIEDNCVWHGKLANNEVNDLMRKADLFFFTSIMEATSTVVLEAIQNRLPIVCHDTCGFGSIVNDSIGRKIKLRTPQDSINDFAEVIESLYNNKNILEEMLHNFDNVTESLTYENKAKKVFEIYKELTQKRIK